MDFIKYKDKVRACWLGKNIGGTLGAPLEGRREVFDLSFYVHDISQGVIANDDLDLQLVWLLAAEEHGQNIDSGILSEYWLTYIPCDWSEYGAGKNNMRFGLLPPVTGTFKNPYKNSNGCFIRSEIWACLTPQKPDLTVKYAFEDAITDHGEEGVYAELFCAAIQSSAFSIPSSKRVSASDIRDLIEIGLSFIPSNCMTAKCINTAKEYYASGHSWQEARKAVLKLAPSTFGLRYVYDNELPNKEPESDIPMGETGYDAPSNIGIVAIGLLYGEGDFTKSLCIAANCGEDTDCTAGTIGALMGIILGTNGIEEKWTAPIGDVIKTATLDLTKGGFPTTVSELTRRITALMPTFMREYCSFDEHGRMYLSVPDLHIENITKIKCGLFEYDDLRSRLTTSPLTIRRSNSIIEVGLSFDDIYIQEQTAKKLTITVYNRIFTQQWLTLKWHMPEDFMISGGQESHMYIDQYTGKTSIVKKYFLLYPGTLQSDRYDMLLEVLSQGRPSRLYIPFIFMQNDGIST